MQRPGGASGRRRRPDAPPGFCRIPSSGSAGRGTTRCMTTLAPPPAPVTHTDPAGPDAELLGRFLADRSEAAFAELVRRHGPLVRRACRGVLGDGPDADDCFQAAFLVLAERAAAVRNRASVGSWLFGVADRVARTARRRAGRAGPPLPTEPPAMTPDPADAAGRAETLAAVDEE